ncbi:MAG: spore maturation protein A [Clostridia bacterium]|nr:spore maturation protein A [Clostridia bacterium]MBQ4626560.1 spore maturation protein A [Clostridia bacterium]
MINYIWSAMIIFSVITAFFTGSTDALTSAIISSASDAVSLCIRLGGTICLWGGLMEIAEKSGLTGAVCRLLSPFLKIIFPKMNMKGATAKAISMNVTANLLGLGNAATPLGLEAMKRLQSENSSKDKASSDMIKFVVMNSAAFHLIPTTVAAMRQDYGSKNPFDIMPASWVSSAFALVVGLTAATVIIRISEVIKWKK